MRYTKIAKLKLIGAARDINEIGAIEPAIVLKDASAEDLELDLIDRLDFVEKKEVRKSTWDILDELKKASGWKETKDETPVQEVRPVKEDVKPEPEPPVVKEKVKSTKPLTKVGRIREKLEKLIDSKRYTRPEITDIITKDKDLSDIPLNTKTTQIGRAFSSYAKYNMFGRVATEQPKSRKVSWSEEVPV